MHARKRCAEGYDFSRLIATHPPLAPLVRRSRRGDATIDFADQAAVLALKQALLKEAYGLPRLGG